VLLGTEEDAQPVQTEPGRYVEFYERMEQAVRAVASRAPEPPTGAEPAAPPVPPPVPPAAPPVPPAAPPVPPAAPPVPPAAPPVPPPVPPAAPPVPLAAGVATLRVIEAARASAAQRVVVPL
jgi:hypothetical protein